MFRIFRVDAAHRCSDPAVESVELNSLALTNDRLRKECQGVDNGIVQAPKPLTHYQDFQLTGAGKETLRMNPEAPPSLPFRSPFQIQSAHGSTAAVSLHPWLVRIANEVSCHPCL